LESNSRQVSRNEADEADTVGSLLSQVRWGYIRGIQSVKFIILLMDRTAMYLNTMRNKTH